MTMRRRTYFILLALSAALLGGGCSGRLVQREGLDSAGRIALVSAVMPRLSGSEREADQRVLQAAADHAAEQVRSLLTEVRPWKVLDAKALGGKSLKSFGKMTSDELAALFPQGEERSRAQAAIGRDLAAWREQFIGATGLLIVPRDALAPGLDAEEDRAVRSVVLQQAGALCHALNVDAVVFVQVRYAVMHPRENAFIVTEDRTDGLLSLSATFVIVDKTGRIIADMGPRPLDDRSPSKDMLPLYRGAGKAAVKAENIDLADPRKKVQGAFTQLIDEAVADLIARLKEDLKQ